MNSIDSLNMGSMRNKRRRNIKAKTGTAQCLEVILLDAAPIRKRALQAVRRANTELNRATEAIEEFEKIHYPAFEQWEAREFGALLTELRELERSIAEKAQLIGEVEWEFIRSGATHPHSAYQAVKRRRESPSANESEAQDDPFGDAGDAPEPEPVSAEEMFAKFVEDTFGIDPDELDSLIYETMFSTFKAKYAPRNEFNETRPHPEHAQEKTPEHSRLKTLYRNLVRRLHPDCRGETVTAREKELWLAVQAAYHAGDIERLEVLAAKADWFGNQIGEHTSIAQLQGIAAEIRASLKAVRARLIEAKKHFAWNFCKVSTEDISRKFRRQLSRQLQDMQIYAADLDAQILQFSHPPPRRARSARRGRRKSASGWQEQEDCHFKGGG